MSEHVILLHGLARTARSMRYLAKMLERSGYVVHNRSYPSRRLAIESAAEQLFSTVLADCQSAHKIHVVTHSMGGILLRYYLSQNRIAKLGHIVMLAPPNQGSEAVDRLRHWRLFHWLHGPAGIQLGTDPDCLPKKLPAADYPLGIIAGNRSINYYLSTLLPSPNDGKVSVSSTRLQGMTDHLVVPVSHPFIMRSNQVIEQVLVFLQNGRFKRPH